MKLGSQFVAVAVGVTFIILVAIPLLGPCWHLFHGDSISFDGWRVPVPRGFYVKRVKTKPVMWNMSFGTPYFNVPYGHISLFRAPSEQVFSLETGTYGRFKDSLIQQATQGSYQLTSERTLSIAGRPVYCLEFARPAPQPKSLIRCAIDRSDLAIFYEGDSKYAPDAYATIQGMQNEGDRH